VEVNIYAFRSGSSWRWAVSFPLCVSGKTSGRQLWGCMYRRVIPDVRFVFAVVGISEVSCCSSF